MESRVLSMLSQIEHLPAKPKANQILANQTEATHTQKQTPRFTLASNPMP